MLACALAVCSGATAAAPPIRAVVALPGNELFPRWSPDGNSIAFCLQEGTRSNCRAAVVSPAGGAVRTIDDRHLAYENAVEWSPDGQRLTYAVSWYSPPDEQGIWVTRPDGSDKRRVIGPPRRDSETMNPQWSPDGTRIAYWVPGDNVVRSTIRTVRVDGSGETVLAEGARPLWSPDGLTIVFQGSDPARGGVRPFAVSADGGGVRALEIGPYVGLYLGELAWSPDGKELAFRNYEPHEIWVLSFEGTGVRRVAPDGIDPHWSRDGKRIVYGGGSGIEDVGADGRGRRTLVPGVGWTTAGDAPRPFSLSPDGRRMAFQRYDRVKGSDDIYAAEIQPYSPPACRVPRVVGKPLASARTAIRRGGCRVGRIRKVISSNTRRGRVLRQSPRAGTRRPLGNRVAIVVGRGRR